MARIKIEDLPKDLKISEKDMKMIRGGIDTVPLPERTLGLMIGTWPTPERTFVRRFPSPSRPRPSLYWR